MLKIDDLEIKKDLKSIIKIDCNDNDYKKIINLLIPIFEFVYFDDSAITFDCCSKYAECSDSRFCVNINKELARECSYHRKIFNNKIFYGTNRNMALRCIEWVDDGKELKSFCKIAIATIPNPKIERIKSIVPLLATA
jgi:hypothetical protein